MLLFVLAILSVSANGRCGALFACRDPWGLCDPTRCAFKILESRRGCLRVSQSAVTLFGVGGDVRVCAAQNVSVQKWITNQMRGTEDKTIIRL